MVALSITMAASLVGCGGDATAPKSIPYVGNYTLVSVDDAKLPVLYFGADDTSHGLAITGGTFTLKDDNTFIDTVNMSQSVPSNAVAKLIAKGTYAVAGSRLTLTVWDDWFRYYTSLVAGTMEADNLDIYVSFKADGMLFLYRKTP